MSATADRGETHSGSKLALGYPARVLKATWHVPRPEMYHDYRGLIEPERAQQAARVSYPTPMLSLISEHNGDPLSSWLVWLHDTFADMGPAGSWWDDEAPAEFVHRHNGMNHRLVDTYKEYVWKYAALREDLSHLANLEAADFAKVRLVQMDEVNVKPGRLRQFEQHRKALALALAAAEIEHPVWVYEVYSGGRSQSFQVWTAYRDLAQLDLAHDNRARIEEALGAEGSEAAADAAAASIKDSLTTLFVVNPGASYMPPEITSAAPAFWSSTSPYGVREENS
jgi:hypothetical protein